TQQPDRHVVLALREHPQRLAAADHVILDVLDPMAREERLLEALMIGEAAALELLDRDSREVELQRLTDHDVLPEAQAVQVAQPLRTDFEPFGIVTERLERLHENRVARDRVIA